MSGEAAPSEEERQGGWRAKQQRVGARAVAIRRDRRAGADGQRRDQRVYSRRGQQRQVGMQHQHGIGTGSQRNLACLHERRVQPCLDGRIRQDGSASGLGPRTNHLRQRQHSIGRGRR